MTDTTEFPARIIADVARQVIGMADALVSGHLSNAMRRAVQCADNAVPYVMGGKTLQGLDCSGLTSICYPNLLPHGVEMQMERTKNWAFSSNEIRLAEPGDLMFFSQAAEDRPTHVGIVSDVITSGRFAAIHASERQSRVTRDEWDDTTNRFCQIYQPRHLIKMHLFLRALFIHSELLHVQT